MPKLVSDRADTLPILGDIFREYGYAGASLSIISKATGLGKGSLYNFFPGGKAEMMTAVLAEIDTWFEANVFAPLRSTEDPPIALSAMFENLTEYFRSGERVCLLGALALTKRDDDFSKAVSRYFRAWIKALEQLFGKCGVIDSTIVAEAIVADIQGAIVVARALQDRNLFARRLATLEQATLDRIALAGPV